MSKPLVFGVNYQDSLSKDFWLTDKYGGKIVYVEPIGHSVLLTRQELEQRDRKMIADAWDAGRNYEYERFNLTIKIKAPDKQQYIDQLVNPK